MTKVDPGSASVLAPADEALGFKSHTTRNSDVRLHWLELGEEGEGVPAVGAHPFVFVPGFGEEAWDHREWLATLGKQPGRPRRVVIPDLRGRGRSDAPASNYALEDHVSDLDAILNAAGCERCHLFAYSRGTAYAVAWAIAHKERVASLMIGDYPAEHIVPPAGAIEFLAGRKRFGRPMTDRISRWAMEQVFDACQNQSFYAALSASGIPVLLIRGGRETSMVTTEVLAAYREQMPDMEIEVFGKEGHDLWASGSQRLVQSLTDFAAKNDSRDPAESHA